MTQPEDDATQPRDPRLEDDGPQPDFTPVDSDADEAIQRLHERLNDIRGDVQEAQAALAKYEARKRWLTVAGTIGTAVAIIASTIGMVMSLFPKQPEKTPAERRELRKAIDEAVRQEKELLRKALSD